MVRLVTPARKDIKKDKTLIPAPRHILMPNRHGQDDDYPLLGM